MRQHRREVHVSVIRLEAECFFKRAERLGMFSVESVEAAANQPSAGIGRAQAEGLL
jgi:hypothetical protein